MASVVKVVILSLYGVDSSVYFHAYHIPNLAIPFWQLLLLLSIYLTIARRESATSRILWALAFTVLVSIPIIWKVWAMEGESAYLRFHMMTLPAQVVACLLVYLSAIQNRGIRLGNNLHFLMLGLGIMVGLQSLNFLEYFSQALAPQSFQSLVPGIYMLALSTLVVGFWRYDPMIVAADSATMVRVESSFIQSMSILLRRLFERT